MIYQRIDFFQEFFDGDKLLYWDSKCPKVKRAYRAIWILSPFLIWENFGLFPMIQA